MAVKDKETIFSSCLMFCIVMKMLQPLLANLLIRPAVRRDLNNYPLIDLAIKPAFLDLFALKNDE